MEFIKMQIINKRVTIVIIFIMFVVILKINSHYSSLKQSYIYNIGAERFSLCYASYYKLYSPTKQYYVSVDICKKDKISFIRGRLYIVGDKNKETKFWKIFI